MDRAERVGRASSSGWSLNLHGQDDPLHAEGGRSSLVDKRCRLYLWGGVLCALLVGFQRRGWHASTPLATAFTPFVLALMVAFFILFYLKHHLFRILRLLFIRDL